jgi:hypothetical protein
VGVDDVGDILDWCLQGDHVGELLHQFRDVVADAPRGDHNAVSNPDLHEALLVGLDTGAQVG